MIQRPPSFSFLFLGAYQQHRNALSAAKPLLCALNDLILKRFIQIAEIIAVSRHAHDQIPVLLRIFLGRTQGVPVHHVELDVMAVHIEVGADQIRHTDRKSVV